MTNKITVVLTSWQVPFAQIVNGIFEFDDAKQALRFINEASRKWWDANDGERAAREGHAEDYNPIEELGYDAAHYELWSGECGFDAILDNDSYQRLQEAHYKREFDDKGMKRPGYLRAAQGEDVSAEIAELYAFYSTKH